MIFKTIMCILILFLLSGCSNISDCQQKSTFQFDNPINQWVNIQCKDGNEYLAPEEGYAWVDINGEEVVLFADLRQAEVEESGGHYFESQTSKIINGYSTIRNFNKYLNENVGGDFSFNDIYYSRVFTEGKKTSYELCFYVDEGESRPAFLTITVANGWVLEPASYKIVKK